MPSRNVKVFDPDVTLVTAAALSPLRVPQSRRPLIAAQIRLELSIILKRVVDEVTTERGYNRSGRARNLMRQGGVRVFGTTFTNIRGHIIGPSYILRQEEGGTIEPQRTEKLALPVYDGLRPDGTPKLPGPRSWANIKKTFIYKSKKTGSSFIAYKEGDKLRLLYVLVDFAEVEGRGLMAAAWRRNSVRFINALGRIVAQEIAQFDFVRAAGIASRRIRGRGRG